MKTGMPYTIVLLPKAIAILKKYNYDLNLMSNQKCNDQLKIIANLAKLHINLTMHVGRHNALSLYLKMSSLQKSIS